MATLTEMRNKLNERTDQRNECIETLRIARYHVDAAVHRANALAYVNDQQGLHGNAEQHRKAANESAQALALIDKLLEKLPG